MTKLPKRLDFNAEEIEALIERVEKTLRKGSICPGCGKGKLFNLAPEDDTTARVLSLMKENEVANPERQGMFTTGILGKLDHKQIALFFTGRQHAGENLNDLLNMREETLPAPIQACDALSRNIPKGSSIDRK